MATRAEASDGSELAERVVSDNASLAVLIEGFAAAGDLTGATERVAAARELGVTVSESVTATLVRACSDAGESELAMRAYDDATKTVTWTIRKFPGGAVQAISCKFVVKTAENVAKEMGTKASFSICRARLTNLESVHDFSDRPSPTRRGRPSVAGVGAAGRTRARQRRFLHADRCTY